MTNYDVLVIGAGTSGMMAALQAAKAGARVALIEKNRRVGKKLLLTGGGRCNVTNNREPEEIIAHIPGNGKFLFSAFSQFTNYDVMAFFAEQGIALKEEDHGRMFPVTDRSKTIVAALQAALEESGVSILTKHEVQELCVTDGQLTGVLLVDGAQLNAPCVIVSTGGATYSYTGSTGIGYQLAKQVGHRVTPLYPTESPLRSDEPFIEARTLQGISLRDIRLSVRNEQNKELIAHQMDALFTHFGISGPAALRCSMFVQQLLRNKEKAWVSLDCIPQKTAVELANWFEQAIQRDGEKSLKNIAKEFVPERLAEFFVEHAGIDPMAKAKQVDQKPMEVFLNLLKDFRLHIYDTWPLEKSFVTGGGIELKEIHPRSLESKKMPGLFFTGEVLDINGYTGGYNITAAFVTGAVAGKHAAEIASYSAY